MHGALGMPGTGVTFEDWVLSKVDRQLEYGDSRSKYINDLTRVGLAAEETAEPYGAWPEDVEDQEDFVREAIAQYIQDQKD